MKEEKMKVLMVEPGKKAYLTEIGTDLEDLQRAVDGYIETCYPFEDDVCIVCNEEGKLNGMEANRAIYKKGTLMDIIYGPFFICGVGDEDFESLADDLAGKYQKLFDLPCRFIRFEGGKLNVIEYEPAQGGTSK